MQTHKNLTIQNLIVTKTNGHIKRFQCSPDSSVWGSTGRQLPTRMHSAVLSQMGLVAGSSALLVQRALFFWRGVSLKGRFCWLLFLTSYSAILQSIHLMHLMGTHIGTCELPVESLCRVHSAEWGSYAWGVGSWPDHGQSMPNMVFCVPSRNFWAQWGTMLHVLHMLGWSSGTMVCVSLMPWLPFAPKVLILCSSARSTHKE
jgi:hypothetical protein